MKLLRGKEFVTILAVVLALTLFGGAVSFAAPPIEEIRTVLTRFALRPPSPDTLAALNVDQLAFGLRAIDRYSQYIPPPSPAGTLTVPRRLGIDIISHNNQLWVRPDHNGPADKAGLPEISELRAINGKSVAKIDLASVSSELDGALQKKTVKLTVSEPSKRFSKTFTVKSAFFQPPSFSWRQKDGFLIIRIREFIAHETAPGVIALLKTLAHLNSLIVIDLRGCSGGDLFEPIEIAGMLVPSGVPLVSTYDRSGQEKKYHAPSGKKLGGNFWVLMDHDTASAAEILAGILQHHHIALLAGETSVGKCVSQTVVPLTGGGGLSLTTHEVFFPGKTSCNDIGLKPDINIPDIGTMEMKDISRNILKRNSLGK